MSNKSGLLADCVVNDGGQVNRKVFCDPEIYALETERLFGRAWLFLAHESQLTQAGDYLTTFMGEDPVVVIRQKDGSIKAFINACRHRGALLVPAEEGCSKFFQCPYHGWVYGMDGSLHSVRPEGGPCYGERKKELGLRPIRVESYRGLYFGNFDHDAPSLDEFLGDFKYYLDVAFYPSPAGVEFVGGTMRQRLKCNWKLPSENLFADNYHVFAAHGVAAEICAKSATVNMDIGIEPGVSLGYSSTVSGHGVGFNTDGYSSLGLLPDPKPFMEFVDQHRASYVKHLGPERAQLVGSSVNGGVFPNFLFVPGFVFRVVHPRGPNECDMWTWAVVDKQWPDEMKVEMVKFIGRMLGTSGMFETDDCTNMERIATTAKGWVGRNEYSDYTMGQGEEQRHAVYPGFVDQRCSDVAFRGYYRRWNEFMTAENVRHVAPTENSKG
ncbi:MAG: aromatic ring-hydroxylating dioxygenase subunit alpha [Gammaproteobacteria bacterium]|nr:MAG: aromatic ring-hydroxylating dioxygenase subunit alpha [Gammaproteobacteria bacterium]